MTVSNQKVPPVFNSLLRHPHIRAVVWINGAGTIKAKKGQAYCLRLGADDATVMMPLDTTAEGPQEAIYITNFDGADFLIVIFDEAAEFEAIKEDVDTTLEVH